MKEFFEADLPDIAASGHDTAYDRTWSGSFEFPEFRMTADICRTLSLTVYRQIEDNQQGHPRHRNGLVPMATFRALRFRMAGRQVSISGQNHVAITYS